MDIQQILAAVATPRDYLYNNPAAYVKKWSSQQCGEHGEYYDIPLIRLIAFLRGEANLNLNAKATSVAILDIVQRSPLKATLEHEAQTNSIQYKKEITADQKRAIANYLNSRGFSIAD